MTCARAPVCSLLSLLLIHTTAAVTLNSADCSFSNRQSNRQSTRRAEPIAYCIAYLSRTEHSTAQHSTEPLCTLADSAHLHITYSLSNSHIGRSATRRDSAQRSARENCCTALVCSAFIRLRLVLLLHIRHYTAQCTFYSVHIAIRSSQVQRSAASASASASAIAGVRVDLRLLCSALLCGCGCCWRPLICVCDATQ